MLRCLTEQMILSWADVFREAMGRWPTRHDGAIAGTRCENWGDVDRALSVGDLGLPGGSSLARLLAEYRGVRNPAELPPLTHEQILIWADAFHELMGKWPTENSGPIPNSGGETWLAVDTALRNGARGLPGGYSLPLL